MTTLTPDRSREQYMDALKQAQETRMWRAHLKRDVKAGRVSVADVLRNPPELALTMRVLDLLLALPHWGRARTGRVLLQVGASHVKTIGGLSERQRRELVEVLR